MWFIALCMSLRLCDPSLIACNDTIAFDGASVFRSFFSGSLIFFAKPFASAAAGRLRHMGAIAGRPGTRDSEIAHKALSQHCYSKMGS